MDELLVEPNTTTSLQVSWSTDRVCIDHFVVCYYEHSVPVQTCFEEDNTETLLEDLFPCTDYTVIVTAITPFGRESNKTYSGATTLQISKCFRWQVVSGLKAVGLLTLRLLIF